MFKCSYYLYDQNQFFFSTVRSKIKFCCLASKSSTKGCGSFWKPLSLPRAANPQLLRELSASVRLSRQCSCTRAWSSACTLSHLLSLPQSSATLLVPFRSFSKRLKAGKARLFSCATVQMFNPDLMHISLMGYFLIVST